MTKQELLTELYDVKGDVELLITALNGCCRDEDSETVEEIAECVIYAPHRLQKIIIEMATGKFKNDAILL